MTTTTIRFYDPTVNPDLKALRDSVIEALARCARYGRGPDSGASHALEIREDLLQVLDRVEQLVPRVARDQNSARTEQLLLAAAQQLLVNTQSVQGSGTFSAEFPGDAYWLPTVALHREV